MTDISNYFGRLLLRSRFDQANDPRIKKMPAFDEKGRCSRCGQRETAVLPNHEFFCTACLKMGRNASFNCFFYAEENATQASPSYLTWQGRLTDQQSNVSTEIIQSLESQTDRLIWAVTGAGKTEMIFPAIDHALKKGQRVAMVSPRIDVILELAPRLRQAFNGLDLLVLYGDTPEEYHYTKLVLATSHQLMKFYRAFDLLIIDEVDSFPFRGDSVLEFASKRAKKREGSTIYLTATPTKKLLKAYKGGQLATSFLPLRFHQHLLPELFFSQIGNWRKEIFKARLPKKLRLQLKEYEKNGQRFLLFVPTIRDLDPLLKNIQNFFKMTGLSVHAADPQRKEKVQQMRDKSVQFLVTTTILERGVTLPGIDVIILGADDQVFTTNAIVQIAGRVGRNTDRPTGLVLALIQEQTAVLKEAAEQIRFMNQKGREQRDGK
ncbi:MAG: DEAD/DEAH box helicase [Oenococcus sicerae]|uniref:DEAD/DEAH box helicase n=1 Tax=Oenococcus sicerae TaxID=2203724 RepID=UPI0039EBC516